MSMFSSKFIFTMLYPETLLITKIYEAIIAAPTIGVDNGFKFYPASYNALEGCP